MKQRLIYPFLKGGVLSLLISFSVYAQVQTPTDTESAMMIDAINQNAGSFDQVDLSYIHSMGMQQKAWNNPMEHLGEGQTKPGYSKYNWAPDTVLPVRLREGMMTLINLPAWELIEKVHIGSPESFSGEIVAPNSLLIYADPSYIGVDSNMIVFGRSGNRYVFYLRSETFNTDKITQSVVDVLVGPRWTPVADGGQMADNNGASSMAATPTVVSGTGKVGAQASLATASTGPKDWLKTIPMDPESIKFDLDMFLPNPDDVDIAPDNIWRDNIFTYIDLGPKALTMTQRPIVNLLVQDTEVPVGYRTRGPNSRLIVVEAIGDLVLRNGKKLICIKLRRDPAAGLEYTDYTGSVANTQMVGGMPTNPGPANPYQSSNALIAGGGAVLYDSAEPNSVLNPYGTSLMTEAVHAPYATSVSPYCYDETGSGRCRERVGWQNLPSIPQDVRQNSQTQQVIQQAAQRKGDLVPNVGSESIAIEFGTGSQIAELETLWNKIYSKNKDILAGYEPYYSVDATADGGMMEVFRLRAGMVKDVSTADALCRKIGRRGFSCSVIRIQ